MGSPYERLNKIRNIFTAQLYLLHYDLVLMQASHATSGYKNWLGCPNDLTVYSGICFMRKWSTQARCWTVLSSKFGNRYLVRPISSWRLYDDCFLVFGRLFLSSTAFTGGALVEASNMTIQTRMVKSSHIAGFSGLASFTSLAANDHTWIGYRLLSRTHGCRLTLIHATNRHTGVGEVRSSRPWRSIQDTRSDGNYRRRKIKVTYPWMIICKYVNKNF